MSIAVYNLDDEERYLKSYLENTTAVAGDTKDHDADKADSVRDDEEGNCCNDGAGGNCCGDDGDELTSQRVYCCNTSRSLYCPECCKVLVPKECWPQRFIRRQQQKIGSRFPFEFMDIILGVKERRTSSTGIQLMCISNMIADAAEQARNNTGEMPREYQQFELGGRKSNATGSYESEPNDGNDCGNRGIDCTDGVGWWRNIKLYDLNRGDTLPQHSTENPAAEQYEEGTYVLFPQEGKSVPISAVANKIKRLVVLDIKWSRSYNVQLFSADHHKILVSRPNEGGGGKTYNPLAPLKDLPFVHLEHPPQNSNFWRWHNRGAGMLSTIEAIYFAAREASVALQHQQDIGEEGKNDDGSNYEQQGGIGEFDEDTHFVDILWLFALQRSIIQKRSLQEGRPVAFSEEAKAMARALRKQGPPEKC